MPARKSILDSEDIYQLSGFAEVQRVRKAVPYTVTLIGDSQALGQWKLSQVAKEIQWQKAETPKRAQRRANAIAAVSEQDGRRSDENKIKDLAAYDENVLRRKVKPKAVAVQECATEVYVPQPEPSFIKKTIKWIKSLVS